MNIAWLSNACQRRHGRLTSSLPCAPSARIRTMEFATSVAELHGLLLHRTLASRCLEAYYQDKVKQEQRLSRVAEDAVFLYSYPGRERTFDTSGTSRQKIRNPCQQHSCGYNRTICTPLFVVRKVKATSQRHFPYGSPTYLNPSLP